ncbi:MAG: hypothetical protein EWV80_06660 [Microcystis aeruginosa Ma_QC_B_20070730_S2]|uniref:Uncharacterized protein n=1 Tax=Microcystis aeruginosa Ma_QC_B_20070730_S2 TaxID=2486256 RepID=A0A552DZI0_MICAE|nr:MAG: hypothetical protein EWV80_06660 [Microcystis aeruginosa Ma_QC_B_20070730_S2]
MIICYLAGLILLQSDFQSWDIIPKQVPHVQLIVVANNPDEQAICAQYLRHNCVRYFALI